MIIQESKLLRESVNQYLILESRQILLENIKNNPKQYFVINEDYKKYCTEEEWKVIEEGIWDTIKDVAGKVGSWFTENPRAGIQNIADVVSIFDPTGIVDLTNGIFYYIFKDYFSAFFSFLGAALVMPGFLLSLSGAGAVAGIPMEIAGKAVQTAKAAIKAGKVSSTAVKDIGIAAKIAAPGIGKISKTLETIPFVGDIGKWLTKSADNVAALATKEGTTIADVSKAVGSTSTEVANNPVVKSLSSKVIDATKKYGAQTAFAGLGIYGVWANIEESEINKLALLQLKEQFEKKKIPFDPESKVVKKYLPQVAEEIRQQKNKCTKQNEEECKTNFEKFSKEFPKTANLITKLGQGVITGAQIGASFLEKTDIRNI